VLWFGREEGGEASEVEVMMGFLLGECWLDLDSGSGRANFLRPSSSSSSSSLVVVWECVTEGHYHGIVTQI